MTLGMNLPSVSPEGTNLLRLIYVIKNPCTACLRHVLNTHIPNGCTDIKHAVSSNHYKLKPVLTRKQYCKLFPQGQLCLNFDVSKCDMTLLYALLRNVSSVHQPSTGWGNPVSSQPRDTSIGANVERLRDLRNGIIHDDRHEISDSEFIGFWDNIETCLKDIDNILGNTTFKHDLMNLKTCNLDPQFIQKEYGKLLQKIQENEKKHTDTCEEIKDTTRKTYDSVSRLEENQNKVIATLDVVTETLMKTLCKDSRMEDEQYKHDANVDEQNNIMKQTEDQYHGCIDGAHCSASNIRVNDPQAIEGCKASQRPGVDDVEITHISNQQDSDERERQDAHNANYEDVQNLHQNVVNYILTPSESMNIATSSENDICIVDGTDGVILLTKQFAYIKSNLEKRDAVQIARDLLKEHHITKEEYEAIVGSKRSSCVDTLLKTIILGDSNMFKSFLIALKVVNQKVFKVTSAEHVTAEDRSRFKKAKDRALFEPKSTCRASADNVLNESDVRFFQYHLSHSKAVVDSLNDNLLARFIVNIREHSHILKCNDLDSKIQTLCETMNLCNINVKIELKVLLKASLYETWMDFRTQIDEARPKYLQWLNSPVSRVRSMFTNFMKADNGSIILTFATGDEFDIASLTREFVRENVTDLLWKGYLETQINIVNPVHVTVYILSSSEGGSDEIQFHLDFNLEGKTMSGEEDEENIKKQERVSLLEQLDLLELTEWITNQPDIDKTTKQRLEDMIVSGDMSKEEELSFLLDSIYNIKDGRDLIKRFCKNNDPDVYNNTFVKLGKDCIQDTKSLEKVTLQWKNGGSLQKLFSLRIDINTKQKDYYTEYPIGTFFGPEENPLKKTDSAKGLDYKKDPIYAFGAEDNPLKKTAFESELLNERSGYDPMEQRVWKKDGITYIIQVGKVEDIWSDVMIIFGKDRKFLPKTIIEKFGPQIQREFNEKYPSGLNYNQVAVLSGFNLPVWKIFYCDCSLEGIYDCMRKAIQFNMTSILVLIQNEYFLEENFRFVHSFCRTFHTTVHRISTIYYHVDQVNCDWIELKVIEDKAGYVHFTDFYRPSFGRTAHHRVFTLGHTPEHSTVTITIQIGKLEEIKSEAMVIFEVGKGQWPLQIISSDILEKAGPIIQEEFQNKYPAGLEYGEVAVLSGHNLPFKHIIYGVLPRWPAVWLEQVIVAFLSKCFEHVSNKGITSIAYWIPRVTYHVAELYISVLRCCMEMQVYDELFSSIPTENKVITDDSTIGQFLITAMEEQWSNRIEFKLGHITLQIKDVLLAARLIGRRNKIETYAKESKEQGLHKSNALLIISPMKNIANILEEINPSLKSEFTTKDQSSLETNRVIILDGYLQPFDKIICGIWKYSSLKNEITAFTLECMQMAENNKMKCISLLFDTDYCRGRIKKSMTRDINLGLRIFALETPSSIITSLHCDSTFIAQELSDATSVKVFKEKHLTVVLNVTYSDRDLYHISRTVKAYNLVQGGQELLKKMNSVYVICDASDGSWLAFDDTFRKIKERIVKSEVSKFVDVLLLKDYEDDTIGVMFGEAKSDRQAMDKFFYTCMEKADASKIPSVTFLVPHLHRDINLDTRIFISRVPHLYNIRLFASSLIPSVKRFAKTMPSSHVKRIVIRHSKYDLQNVRQVFEDEWRNPTEDIPTDSPGVIPDEKSSKDIQVTDDSDIPTDSPGVIPDEKSSKDIQVTDDSVFESELVMEQRVWKENGITCIIQVGKLEDIWGHIVSMMDMPYRLFAIGQELIKKINSVYVICDVSGARWPRHDSFRKIKERIHPEVSKCEDVLILTDYDDDSIGVMFGEAKLDRQAMAKFFYTCMLKADAIRIPSVAFLVPEIPQNDILFSRTLISCVKRFANTVPSSNIKRIIIRQWHLRSNLEVFEDEWMEATEDTQYYPSEDIERKMTVLGWGSYTQGKRDTSSEDIKTEIPVSDSKPQET